MVRAGDRRVLLHVGTHKTGTTAFQRYLAEWRTEILVEHRILVHRGCFLTSHFELPALVVRAELETPDRRLLDGHHGYSMSAEEMGRAIRRTVEADVETVLFTAEGLSFIRTDAEIAALRTMLAPRRVVPIVVLREPAAYLASFRSSHQRWFAAAATDPTSVAYWEPDSWLVDYPALLDVLRRLSGDGTVQVIDYDREMASTGSIVPALAAAIGIERVDLYPGWERRDNVTVP